MSKSARLSPVVEIVALLRELVKILRGKNDDQLAYSVPHFASLIDVSDQQVYNHIDRGDLTPVFSGKKKLISVDEARRFIRELPEEDLGPLK